MKSLHGRGDAPCVLTVIAVTAEQEVSEAHSGTRQATRAPRRGARPVRPAGARGLLLPVVLSLLTPAGGVGQSVTAFTHVAVVPMDRERVLSDQTVVVRDGHIVALGAADTVRIPPGAVQIDGRNKYLLPGLADMHVHFGDITAADDDKMLFLFVANGITTVRDMHSTRGSGRRPDNPLLMLRTDVAAGRRLGPRIYTAGDPDTPSPEAAATSVDELHGLTDFVKIASEEVPGDAYDSIAAVARRVDLKLVGHVPTDRGLLVALHDHWASIEHTSGYLDYLLGTRAVMSGMNLVEVPDTAAWLQPGYHLDPAKLHAIAQATRAAGVWNCPTLQEGLPVFSPPGAADYGLLHPGKSWQDYRLQWPEALHTMADRFQVMQRFKLAIVKALHDAGAGLLLGTDTPQGIVAPVPGFSIHQELALLVEAGLTPYQALAAGTRSVAQFLGAQDSTGTVAVGQRADLVLLNGNPLQNVRYTAGPAGVMVGGQWLPRAAIDARLDSLQTFTDYDLRGVRQVMWR